jgi:type I restriction enzyme, S subunit
MARKLPKGWNRVALRDCIETIESGVSVNGEDRQVAGSEAGVLKVSAVSDGRFAPCQNKKIVADELARARLNPRAGSLIMSRANTPELVGSIAYVEEDHPNLFLSDKLWQIRLREHGPIATKWLNALLSSPTYRKQLSELATGSSQSMQNISQASFLALEVPAPALDEQRRIVRVLDAASRLASLDQQLLAQHEARHQWFLRAAFRPVDQQRAKGWRRVHLGDIFAERDERSGDLPLLAITGGHGVVPRDELERRDTSADDKSNYKVIRKGDIGYNTMRMWQGVFGLSAHDGIVSPAYTVVTPDRTRILGEFAAHLFSHPRVVHTFRRYSQGLVDDTLMLKYLHFSEIRLPIPEIPEQRRIAKALDTQLRELKQLRQLVELRYQQHRGLMQELLTGRQRLTRDLPGMEVSDV